MPTTPRSLILAALLFVSLAGPAWAHDGTNVATIPMDKGKVTLSAGTQPKVTLSGRWKGETPTVSPFEQAATLRVFGGFDGDSGALRLDSAKWKQTKKGWRYDDDAGTVGGVTLVELRYKKNGGTLKVKGGGTKWLYEPSDGAEAAPLSATLQLGIHQWCVQFQAPKLAKGKVVGKTKVAPTVYSSTWEGVQAIFERNGCTSPVCHGASPGQGDLNLLPDVAYEQLVNRYSELGGKLLVQLGSRQDSFLWEKLAAATEGYDLDGRGTPMPSGTYRHHAGRARGRSPVDPVRRAQDRRGERHGRVSGRLPAAGRAAEDRAALRRPRRAKACSSTRRRGRSRRPTERG